MITTRLYDAPVYSAKAIADIASYYFELEKQGYYLKTSLSKAYWSGGGLEALGLGGEVDRASLFHLLRGKDPQTLKPLVRLQAKKSGEKRQQGQDRSGLDITFSVPKGVSALWAYLPEKRKNIEECIQSSIQQTLSLIEEHCLTVRTGKGGTNWESGKMVFALFQHCTARNNNDFQLHTHCVVPNLVVGNDGKIRKINTKSLLKFARVAGPLFRNTLLTELAKELGISAYIPRDGESVSESFEVEGLPKDFLRAFSSRRREIEEQVASYGYSNAHSKATQNANFATRKPKGESLPLSDLEAIWQAKAKPFGVTKESMEAILGNTIRPISYKEIGQSINQAIEQLTKHEAVFGRWDVVRKTSELLQDKAISGADVIKGVDLHIKQSRDLVIARTDNEQSIYSTKEMSRMEQETIDCVGRLKMKDGLFVKPKYVEKAIRRSQVNLSDEQVKCVREVLSSKTSIASIVGYAGAGKTTILRVVVDALELSGKRVIGASIGGVAVDKLRESINRESRTIASLNRQFELLKRSSDLTKSLKHHARMFARAARKKATWTQTKHDSIDGKTIFLADESGMIDLLAMHPFLKEVDLRAAGIIFIGDGAQHQPVGPGNPLLHINTRVEVQELQQNWRQTAVEAKAALDVREGNSQEAIKSYIKKGDLVVGKERESAIQSLIKDWSENGTKEPKNSVVIAQTNQEVDLLNRLCQLERLKAGAISGISVEANGKSFHKNDRVIFRETDHLLKIKNGYRGTIVSIGEDGSLTIKIDNRSDKASLKDRLSRGLLNRSVDKSLIKISSKQATRLDLRLGYASTTHSYQGSQADYVFVLLGGKNQDIHLTYVQLSRSVIRTKLYVDRLHGGPELDSIISLMNKQNIKQNISGPTLEHQLKRKPQG